MAVKMELENEINAIQVEACEIFIKKFFSQSEKYAFDRKVTLFDVRMQIKNFYMVRAELVVDTCFKNVKEISIDAVETAFNRLNFKCDRHGIYYKFSYTGPLVYNSLIKEHQMPIGRNQWRTLFQQFQEC